MTGNSGNLSMPRPDRRGIVLLGVVMHYILLLGNLTVGYHAVGPFPSYGAAKHYAETRVAEGFWHIFQLYPLEERDAP
jgi:hypothetical protein